MRIVIYHNAEYDNSDRGFTFLNQKKAARSLTVARPKSTAVPSDIRSRVAPLRCPLPSVDCKFRKRFLKGNGNFKENAEKWGNFSEAAHGGTIINEELRRQSRSPTRNGGHESGKCGGE